ncbi:MAG: hypothetical protein AVDCRST_MAG23-2704, partial [uncultured Sphingosinicella sp.]
CFADASGWPWEASACSCAVPPSAASPSSLSRKQV